MAKADPDQFIDDELGSIIEFEDNIADAEAPLPLPVGNYRATIKGAEQKVSSTGRRYAAVMFYIPTEAYPADYPLEEAPDGITIAFRRVSLENNKASRFSLRRFIENIGAPPVARQLDLAQWIGLEANVTVKHETYEGVTRPVIDRVSAAS